jgi:hypothetical protein
MSFAIVIIIFTILAGIAGSLLANHYSVYALVPVTYLFLALAAAGGVVYGANLSGSAIAALSGVTGLQFGYLLRLFVSDLKVVESDESLVIQGRRTDSWKPPVWTIENRARYDGDELRYPQRRDGRGMGAD